MAGYGVSIYGEDLYGAPQHSVFSVAPTAAVPIDYGDVRVTWRSPGGEWDELRIIRSYVGYPVSVDNGTEVYSSEPGVDTMLLQDTDLLRDRWVYYSWFVLVTDTGEWSRAGAAHCFVPSNYGGAERMYALVPENLRSDALQRFTSILGYSYDLLRNDVNSVMDLHDSRTVAYDLVPLLLQQFGVPLGVEAELEPEQYRRFLRNAVRFYKTKGTLPCVHGVVSAVTGWESEIRDGANLLWTGDMSDFVGGIDGWDDSLNSDIDWVAPVEGTPGALKLTVTGTSGGAAAASIIDRIPFTDDEIASPTTAQFSVSALVRADQVSTATARVSLDWYNAAGGYISSALGTTVMARQGADTIARITANGAAGAASVAVSLVVVSPSVGQAWEWRKVMINRGTAAPYEPGRDLRIYLDITDTDDYRRAVHVDRLSKILPRYLPLGATFTLLDAPAP